MHQLGEPRWRTVQNAAIGYEYPVRSLWWIDPLAYSGSKCIFPLHRPYTPAYYFLFLDFDQSTVLHRFELRRKFGYLEADADDYWQEFLKNVSDQDAATTRPAPSFSGKNLSP